jgi:hypothetical protein
VPLERLLCAAAHCRVGRLVSVLFSVWCAHPVGHRCGLVLPYGSGSSRKWVIMLFYKHKIVDANGPNFWPWAYSIAIER